MPLLARQAHRRTKRSTIGTPEHGVKCPVQRCRCALNSRHEPIADNLNVIPEQPFSRLVEAKYVSGSIEQNHGRCAHLKRIKRPFRPREAERTRRRRRSGKVP